MRTRYDLECLNNARELITKDPSRHYTIDEIARHIGFSASKLKTGFKEVYGLGLYKYLHQQRMEKAKSLLENSDKTLKEISKLLGYKYKENFSTSFKKYFGKSPSQWKNDNS